MNFADKLHELQSQEKEFERAIEETLSEIAKQEADGIPNVGTYNGLKNKLTNYQNKLAALQSEKAELEGVGDEVQLSVESEFNNIAGQGVTLREIVVSEDAYQLISIHMKQLAVGMANENAALIHSYKSEIASLEQVVSELSKIRAEAEALHAENIELGEKVSDLTAKRDAAATELEAVKAENARLKEDAAKLREQLEKRNNFPRGEVDTTTLAERLKAQRKTIYDVVPDREMNPRSYTAKLADTHETIEIPHFGLAGYNILEGEELARFQAEQEAKKHAAEVEEPVQLAPSLDMPKPPQDAEVPAYPVSGEVAPETATVTREEFEALKQQVNALEQRVRVVA